MDNLRTSCIEPKNSPEFRRACGFSKQYWWGQAYPKDPSEDLLLAKVIYAIYDGQLIIGMIAVYLDLDLANSSVEIGHLVVRPKYRNKGLGRLLYNLALGFIQRTNIPEARVGLYVPTLAHWLLRNGWEALPVGKTATGKPKWNYKLQIKK